MILHVYDLSIDNNMTSVNQKHNNTGNVTEQDPLLCYGLDVSRQSFRSWVGYHLGGNSSCVQDDAIKTRLHFRKFRPWSRNKTLLAAWHEGRLLCDNGIVAIGSPRKMNDHLCAQYLDVLEDEIEDDRDHSQIMTFLQNEYGQNITRLEAANWNQESDDMKLEASYACGSRRIQE